MIKAPQTAAFLDALINGTIEEWKSNTWLNQHTKRVVKSGKIRFDAETRRKITLKELKEGYTKIW